MRLLLIIFVLVMSALMEIYVGEALIDYAATKISVVRGLR